MNILIISAIFPPEPVVSAKLSFDLANSLSEKGLVTVISPLPSRPSGFKFSKKPLHHVFKHIQVSSYFCASSSFIGRFRESYSFGKYCVNYIKFNNKEIDSIYANTWPLLAQYLTVKAARKYRIPIVIHVQDIYPESLANKIPVIGQLVNWALRPMDLYILRYATKIVAITGKMKDYLVKTRHIEPSHIEVVNNWQNEENFLQFNEPPTNAEESKTFTLMYLGNIGPVAGCNLLIDAFAQSNIDNRKLVIAGSGSMKENLKNQVSTLQIPNIEFWPVPEGEVPLTQSKSDILLLPIKKGAASTSIPSKLPAYMFSARPIIASVDDDSDTANAIRKAGCGWIVEPENTTKLAALMHKVSALPGEELALMGQKGREYALIHFSKQANLPKLVAIIEKTAKT